MEKIYELEKNDNGVTKPEYVLVSYMNANFDKTMHDLGLEFCRDTKRGRELYDRGNGLTLEQLLDNAPPELCARYGIRITRLNQKAIPANQERDVLGRFEVHTYRDAASDFHEKFRRVYQAARRIASQLETQRANHHPALEGWGAEKVSAKALVLANQFVTKKEFDLGLFVKKALSELPVKQGDRATAQTPVDADLTQGGNTVDAFAIDLSLTAKPVTAPEQITDQ